MLAFEHARERLETDVEGAAIAAESQHLGGFSLVFQRRFHTGGNRRCILEQRMHPRHAPGRLRPRRGEHLQAAGGIGNHHVVPGRFRNQPRGQRLAATLTGTVTGL